MTGVKLTHVPYKGSARTHRPDRRPRPCDDRQPAGGAAFRGEQPDPCTRRLHQQALGADEGHSDHRGSRRDGYDAASWFTIAAPAKTPKEIIAKLNASTDKFIKSADGTARLIKLGADPTGGSPADMDAYVQSEIEKWGKVAQFAGIKPE